MKFELTMEDFTILQNAIHYYKHVEKRGNFQQYDIKRCEELRNKLAYQLTNEQTFACPDCINPDCPICAG